MSPRRIAFHAFTDLLDEHFSTFAEAKVQVEKWRAEGHKNLRIYRLTYDKVELDVEGCLFAEGDFPM